MGSNSPANPWHDLLEKPMDGTRWFDDPTLEKRFVLGLSGSRRFGALRLFGEFDAGVAIDALRLRAPAQNAGASDVDNDVMIFAPVAGQVDPILRVNLAASYSLDL